jgi:hypothetical protein
MHGRYEKFWSESLKGRDHLENLGIAGKNEKKYCGMVWIEFMCLRIGTSSGFFGHGTEPSRSLRKRYLLTS